MPSAAPSRCSPTRARTAAPPAIVVQLRHHRGRLQHQLDSVLGARQSRHPLGERGRAQRNRDAPDSVRGEGAGSGERARHGGKVPGEIKEIGSRPGGQLADDCLHSAAPFAPWTRTSASGRSWIARRPTPTFRCRWACRRSRSARADKAAERIPPREWFHPDGREFGLRRILLALHLLARDAGLRA